ncbi:MAG: HIT family protein [Sandaracinaceae bacterium]|nr:HIT family protein [Sandaracinaceae bacterium]
MSGFELDPRLAEDGEPIGRLALCLARLHRDARYPWVVLVPARAGVRELHELAEEDRRALVEEVSGVSRAMQQALGAEKMNVAALGNVVPQLHVHVVARYARDDAWPRPVFGAHPPLPYQEEALAERVALLARAFSPIPGFVPALRSGGVSAP